MQIDPIPVILLALLLGVGLVYLVLHWRYHPRETELDSFHDLTKRLAGGKPTLIQFHAPL